MEIERFKETEWKRGIEGVWKRKREREEPDFFFKILALSTITGKKGNKINLHPYIKSYLYVHHSIL